MQDKETSPSGKSDEILFVGQMGSEGRPQKKVLTEMKLWFWFSYLNHKLSGFGINRNEVLVLVLLITNNLKGGVGQEVQRAMEERNYKVRKVSCNIKFQTE